MKKLKWFPIVGLLPLLLPVLVVTVLLGTIGSGSANSATKLKYTNHWSTGDPYTHNLLVHRYGITPEQLDGFLDTLGVAYDKQRINGQKLLEWESKSNMDVRAILSIALHESSLGTAGVATNPGANMFGYGAFDSNPENANNYNDEVAVVSLVKQTIIGNKNETFKIQDDKATKYANGTLNTSTEGGVYFTDTSGSGKRRAETMQKLDQFIDEHGGTPSAPEDGSEESYEQNRISSSDIPAGYSITKNIDTTNYDASTYPWGQCTWFVYNRGKQLGINFDPYMGNGNQWMSKPGYTTTNTPTEHSALSFASSQAGADPVYGHVSFVEQVRSDGSILISESNYKGLGIVSYRTFDAETAKQFTYVIGH